MRSKDEDKLSMYFAVSEVLDNYEAKWSNTPKFQEAVQQLKTNIELLEQNVVLQITPVTGYTKTKQDYFQELVDITLKVANIAYAYAVDVKNEVLKDKVDTARSTLGKSRDTIALESCQLIYDSVQPISSQLTDYGLQQTDLDNQQEAIANFQQNIASPRNAIVNRKKATTKIKGLITQTDALFKDKIDKLMEQYKGIEEDFVIDYFNARKVVGTGSRFTIIIGKVIAKNNKQGIEKALITLIRIADGIESTEGIEQEGIEGVEGIEGIEEQIEMKVVTNAEGNFRIEKLPAGNFALQIARKGFETHRIEKPDIRRGAINNLGTIELKPAKQLPGGELPQSLT